MNLFEINEAIKQCILIDDSVVDGETGEILDTQYLDDLVMAKDEKIENIAKWIKNLESDAEALKKQKDVFAKRQKAAEDKKESLKRYLSIILDGEKWDRSKDKSVAISFRKSESVNIADASKIPSQYLVAQEPKIDKAGIKADIKKGITIDGASLIVNQNIQIK